VLKRQRRAWYFYDFANSSFSATVITVFLGPYLTEIARDSADANGNVPLFGLNVPADSLYPWAISASVIVQVFTFPLVGAIADHIRNRAALLGLFAYAGSLATMALYLVGPNGYLLGSVLLVFANVAFGASIVVYNAFLPDIAGPNERDKVSSRGWALGFLGGGILLIFNLFLYLQAESFGVAQDQAVRISLLSAGAWWALWSIIPVTGLRKVRNPGVANGLTEDSPTTTWVGAVGGRLAELWQTAKEARKYPQTLKFLAAFLLYNDGIQTVIALSGTYALLELSLAESEIVGAVMVVQFAAIFGALALGYLAGKVGSSRVILGSLVIWVIALVIAYYTPVGAPLAFASVAGLIGFVLGGSQALSRSLFSQMIPRDKEAQYFGVFEIANRGTAWVGTAVFGIGIALTGSYRTSILVLVVFFILGGLLLWRTNIHAAIAEVGNPQPAKV
jgi:UMF1 family MFS transporter